MNDRFADDGPCVHCGKCGVRSPELLNYVSVDPCLGVLPDVTQACCGHGGLCDPYVVIAPGNAPGTFSPHVKPGTIQTIFRNESALLYFTEQGVGPPR
jgi:hypothetical protein